MSRPDTKQFATAAALAALLGYSLRQVDRNGLAFELRDHKACFAVRDFHSIVAILGRLQQYKK